MMRIRFSVLAVTCALPLFACGGKTVGPKLYDRSGSIQIGSLAELEGSVLSISRAAQAPIRDRIRDLDDLPMYLLSNEDVTILVRHKAFEEPCDWSKGCEWEYSLTSTSASLDQAGQRQVVDRSFAVISQLKL
jgi:hypothetical protein